MRSRLTSLLEIVVVSKELAEVVVRSKLPVQCYLVYW